MSRETTIQPAGASQGPLYCGQDIRLALAGSLPTKGHHEVTIAHGPGLWRSVVLGPCRARPIPPRGPIRPPVRLGGTPALAPLPALTAATVRERAFFAQNRGYSHPPKKAVDGESVCYIQFHPPVTRRGIYSSPQGRPPGACVVMVRGMAKKEWPLEYRLKIDSLRQNILTYLAGAPERLKIHGPEHCAELSLALGKCLVWIAGTLEEPNQAQEEIGCTPQSILSLGKQFQAVGLEMLQHPNEPHHECFRKISKLQNEVDSIRRMAINGGFKT